MKRINPLASLLCMISVIAATLQTAVVSQPSEEPPREWIEKSTGHRVVRLSDQAGLASLYFHQNPYTATGDKMIASSPQGLWTIDLATRANKPLVEGRASHVVVGAKTRKAFYIQNDTRVPDEPRYGRDTKNPAASAHSVRVGLRHQRG